MKKVTLALALVAASFQVVAAEEVKPAGLLPKIAPVLVTTAVIGGAIAAANHGGSSGTSGTTP